MKRLTGGIDIVPFITVFLYGLFVLVLMVAIYSAISKLKRKR
jgi:hypothetical protein